MKAEMQEKSTFPEEGQGHVSGQANEPLTRPAHALEYAQVLQELGADSSKGLGAEEAAQRLTKFGANDLGEEKGVQPLAIFIQQIVNAMTMVRLHWLCQYQTTLTYCRSYSSL